MTLLGNQILIGGKFNAIYVWDRLKFYYDYRIYLPETFVTKLLTINTTVYIFSGNRGRIYQTNGSQASLYKKIPDHLSDTVEPYLIRNGLIEKTPRGRVVTTKAVNHLLVL
jgi:hypothetical protein